MARSAPLGKASPEPRLVCVAAVAAAHGVRGALKLKCFTEDPADVGSYGPLLDEAGRELFTVRVMAPAKGGAIVEAEGITDRDAAEALRGVRLYIPRERLPEPEDGTFYYEDLVGLAVQDTAGRPLGRVIAVHDFGAGEVIEFQGAEGEGGMVPFTMTLVPEVDLAHGRLVLAPEALEATTPTEERAP
jgi:16S rRNA processing protein RimM